ncbi:MAG: ATP-dependent helicase C-terminal domain-containing protein, partial [Bdellovibrionales bacterium]
GDVLAFLPGSGEIERTRRQLNDWAQSQNVQLHSLHGSIPLEQQRQILAPSTSRRIVLSTNVAESSVTVNGVDCVVDSGLVKVLRQDPRTGFSRLEMSKVSQASATQRAGRAARQRPGQCYRMWSANEHSQLSPYEQPEVLRIDISESLLFLAAQGVSDFANFAWFQTPSPTQIKRASRDLHDLGALDEKNKITPLGLKMLAWPLPPRLAKLMVIAEKKKQTTLAADLAALLLERDLLQSKASENYLGDAWECDLSLRWSLLQNWRARQSDQDVLFHAAKNVDAAAKQLARSATRRPAPEEALDQIPGLLLEAFADRLCRRRGQTERAAMSGGRGVRLSPQSVVKTSPFFLALDGVDQEGSADTLVSYACGFKAEALRSYLKNEIQTRERIYFDENSERFVTVKESVWRDFVFEESQPRPANANSIHEALIEAILTRFDWLKTQNESLKKWFERWNFFVAHQQTEALTEEQLKAALTNACFGCTSVKAVAEKDLIYHFESQLPPATLRVFQKQVPDKIQVPSGTWIDIHYPANQPPFLQVRLQELFGLNQTPTVLNGKVPIVLQLLAPNFRPVQTTSDLTSFWRSGYFEVRKELKIRYPKHSWPEDPLKAKPEAKGRRRS